VGDRVTVPFVCACGDCRECRAGDHQVCPYQQQPGFTYWGSFAEYVAVPYAEVNLVRLPDEIGFTAAASLGCRFATAYRGVARVGAALPGEWLVVFGCGGVGLSAVMIGNALGARVVAVDVSESALAAAAGFGAEHTVRAGAAAVGRLRELTDGGPQVTVDAIGAVDVVQQALSVLRPRGRHVQLGLLPGAVTLEVSALIARELRWVGSHGLAAHDYPALLELVRSGAVRPDALVGREIGLADASAALVELDRGRPTGMTVIRP
jgi:alcohol dehydrogenase